MRLIFVAAVAVALCTPAGARDMSDAQIKRAIIQESIGAYPGPCACPYNVARNGSTCGQRSAYSRPGGYSPICYTEQVTREMIREYRVRH
jgi:hypothetical protein